MLDEEQFRQQLLAKLVEEAQDGQTAPAGELVAELADVLEVLQNLVAVSSTSWQQLEAARAAKQADRGDVDSRIAADAALEIERAVKAWVRGLGIPPALRPDQMKYRGHTETALLEDIGLDQVTDFITHLRIAARLVRSQRGTAEPE